MTEPTAVRAVKAIHTAIWLAVESAVVYLLYAGLTRKSGRSVAIAGGVVAAETAVFAANGFRCPLTDIAESLGADAGSVTDTYLPEWFARSLPAIHTPILGLLLYLHRDSLRIGWRRLNRS